MASGGNKKREEKSAEDDAPRGPRPFWSGTISFGLVSLPVSLFVATRGKRVSLRMVDEQGNPLSRRYFCPKEERALDADEIVRGYEVERDRFVVIDDDELAALAPEKSQEIDLRRFVDLDEIDPIYFERAYFFAPDKGAVKAYRLLAKSMEDSRRAGIATFVMRGKEYLAAIIAESGLLRAQTLRFADELRSPAAIGLPDLQKPPASRVRDMERAIRAKAAKTLKRDQLEDRDSQRVVAYARKKLKAGKDVVAAPVSDDDDAPRDGQGAEAVDLMAALKQSLEQEA